MYIKLKGLFSFMCRGCRNTAQLITAFRSEDQVIAVMPFHESDDFRVNRGHMHQS